MIRQSSFCGAGVLVASLLLTASRPLAVESQQEPETLVKCWDELASEDAGAAYRAIWLLARNPDQAVKLLAQRLQPAPPPDGEKIQALIADLDNPKFPVREKASKELEKLGELAERLLLKALDANPALETRQRIDGLLSKLRGVVSGPEKLRQIRAVEVLEIVGNDEAKELLKWLAQGDLTQRMTREAGESLGRLEKRIAWKGPAIGSAFKIDPAEGDPLPWGAVLRLGMLQFRQPPGQYSLRGEHSTSFSADSKVLANVGDHGVYLWETQTGKLLRKLPLSANCVAFAPTGRNLAACLKPQDKQTTVVLWDSANDKELRRVGPWPGQLEELHYTLDGKQLIGTSKTMGLRMWDAETLKETKSWQPPTGRERAISFSRDGNLAAISQGFTVELTDLRNNSKRVIDGFQTSPDAIALSPDGKWLATASVGAAGVRIWDTSTGKPALVQKSASDGFYRRFTFSPDSTKLIATTLQRGENAMWDLTTGKALRLPANMDRWPAAAFSPDGKWLAGGVTTLRVWNLQSGEEVNAGAGHLLTIEHAALLPSAGFLATGDSSGAFRFWDAASGKQKSLLSISGDDIRGAAFAPDGKWFAANVAGGRNETLELREIPAGGPFLKLPGHGRTGLIKRLVQITPDGRHLLTWGGSDFFLRKWDVKTGKLVVEFRPALPGMTFSDDPDQDSKTDINKLQQTFDFVDAAFSPDGAQMLVASRSGQIHVHNIASAKETRVFKFGIGEETSRGFGRVVLAVSPTGRYFAVRGSSTSLSIFNMATGETAATVPLDGESVAMEFSPDGRTLHIAKGNQLLAVELASGKTRLLVKDLPTNAKQFALSPEGRFILMAMEDTTALVWDLRLLAAAKQ